MQEDSTEVWGKVPDYEFYEVSNQGRIRSISRVTDKNNGRRQRVRGVILKLGKDCYGYPRFQPQNREIKKSDRAGKWLKIHRLVAAVFIGDANGLCVNHKNGIKDDNRVENLEYVTRSENVKHAFRTGLCDCRGEKQWASKLKTEDIILIRSLYEFATQEAIAAAFNITRAYVSEICSRRKWKHVP